MSEKPFYHAVQTVPAANDLPERIARDWDLMTGQEVADRLNTQAEQLEVLREWIRNSLLHHQECDIKSGAMPLSGDRTELAKRRLAALEGQ